MGRTNQLVIKRIIRTNQLVIKRINLKATPHQMEKINPIAKNHLVAKEMGIRRRLVKMMIIRNHSPRMVRLPAIMAFIIVTAVHQVKLSKRSKKNLKVNPYYSNQA